MKKSAKPKRKMQVYAFIDTNIFLDFYRSRNETTLAMLEKLNDVSDRIISTYQVEMEFLKNRQSEIVGISRDSQSEINANLPAVVGDSRISDAVKRHKLELKKNKKKLDDRVGRILKTPSTYDPIYRTLGKIFSSESEHVLTRDMAVRHQIKRLAWRRFMLGYPPRKQRDTSIGDALNWEWIVHCGQKLQGKFLIVSRDSDFGAEFQGKHYLNDALRAEFRDRVGKKSIELTGKLSVALKQLEVHITKAEEKSEEQDIAVDRAAFKKAVLRGWENAELQSSEVDRQLADSLMRFGEQLSRLSTQFQAETRGGRGTNELDESDKEGD